MQKIIPNFWYASEAEEAARFYTSIFDGGKVGRIMHYSAASAEMSGQSEGSVLTAEFELAGFRFVAINGGPAFKPNPSISISVQCKTSEEAKRLYEALGEGGSIQMPLDEYPWSKMYGWFSDRLGVSWQVNVPEDYSAVKEKFAVALMFIGDNAGKAEEAIDLYTSIFPSSETRFIARYEKGESTPADDGRVKHAEFALAGQTFMAIDSSIEHKFQFSEGVSLLVECEDQKEIDYYWEKLTEGGAESVCGWLKDRYGVSWQVAPKMLDDMLVEENKAGRDRAMKAMLGMKKLDIQALKDAFDGK